MSDARTLTLALRGHWYGRYGLCYCPAHTNTKTPSLSLSGDDGGRLLAHCHAGCSFTDILDALKGLGLVDGTCSYAPPTAGEMAHIRQVQEDHAAKQEARALACWRETKTIAGTLAETYLRSRGIVCDLPCTLRFHPSCWHPTGERLPALVALVEGAPRAAIHRTYLQKDGNGKTAVEPAKAMLGMVAGGTVRLSAGSGKLIVCEGIETGLSLLSGLLRGPGTVWAALSTGGMKRALLPVTPDRLSVATDGDAPGREAGKVLATKAALAGWAVSMLPAPDGRDWNDVLTIKGAVA